MTDLVQRVVSESYHKNVDLAGILRPVFQELGQPARPFRGGRDDEECSGLREQEENGEGDGKHLEWRLLPEVLSQLRAKLKD